MTYTDWAVQYPQAAAALAGLLPPAAADDALGKSEAWAQQQTRLQFAHAGGLLWRNNVGATPAKCPDCGAPQRPLRYGLCNDSAQLNAQVKSSDLIGVIPRVITPAHVGATIGQFVAIEAKHPGWSLKPGDKHAQAQAKFLALVAGKGGYATFSTGELTL